MSNQETATPRTDAYLHSETGIDVNSRAAKFMKDLERQLAAAELRASQAEEETRKKVIEECAKICDELASSYRNGPKLQEFQDKTVAVRLAAECLRALSDQPKEG